MPNHAHVLLRTGRLPLSRFIQRWLGPYATTFNLIHRRAGHLFQNRFRSILVEEKPYLLQLVHVAVSHYVFSLASTAEYLRVSRRSVACALDRAPAVLVDSGFDPAPFGAD